MDIEQRIARVRDDREHGSRWLVREAILLLRDLAQEQMAERDEQMRLLYAAARELARARPAMAALSGAVSRILNVEDGPQAIAQTATSLLEEYDTATEHIASYAQPYLRGQLLTCSISGTVLEVLAACRQSIEQVITLEGRPRFEGRVMAKELRRRGVAVTLITDAQAAIFLPQCQAVVVGADSILASGDVLNKAGTALLGWAARGYHVPFYVLCETLKISSKRWSDDPARQTDNLALLEEKEAEEVLENPEEGITVRNFYFDRTPAELVSAWITEHGVLGRQKIAEFAARVEVSEQRLARGI